MMDAERAIIMAAGRSRRMRRVSNGVPKCLLKLLGKSILQHQITMLRNNNIHDISVVGGYRYEEVFSECGHDIQKVICTKFTDLNNLLTLYDVRELLYGNAIILFSDVLLEPDAITLLLDAEKTASLLVDSSTCRGDTMRYLSNREILRDVGSHIPTSDGHGNFVGVARIPGGQIDAFKQALEISTKKQGAKDAYYTVAFNVMSEHGICVKIADMSGRRWMELDTPEDYLAAQSASFYVI